MEVLNRFPRQINPKKPFLSIDIATDAGQHILTVFPCRLFYALLKGIFDMNGGFLA